MPKSREEADSEYASLSSSSELRLVSGFTAVYVPLHVQCGAWGRRGAALLTAERPAYGIEAPLRSRGGMPGQVEPTL